MNCFFAAEKKSMKKEEDSAPSVDPSLDRNAALLDFLMEPEEDEGPGLLKIRPMSC